MALKMSYSTLRWKNPDLEPALEELRKAGWEGWEGRLPLDWLGPPQRLRRVCENTGMPMVVYTASGSPDNRDWEHVERNKRRIEYAAAMEVDCFMFMSGPKPAARPVNEDDIKAAAEGAEAWADYAAQFGLEVSYHIHTNTLIDSSAHWRQYMSLLERTKLCIDVAHAELWGYDPVQAIRDYCQQLNYVHLQDYSSTSRDESGRYLPVWCDVGASERRSAAEILRTAKDSGDSEDRRRTAETLSPQRGGDAVSLDFGAILKTLDEMEFARWVTSCPGSPIPGQDDPLSEARRSGRTREYLRELGY